MKQPNDSIKKPSILFVSVCNLHFIFKYIHLRREQNETK